MLCEQTGLIVNEAVQDETGWDFLVEFPDGVLEQPLTVDTLHVAAPQCRVQVKTSAKAKRRDKVTLANLRRMAIDPLPAFFLFLSLDAAGQVVASHLVHVDHALITRVLARIRRESVGKGESPRFNKKRMTVHAAEADALPPHDAVTFRERLSTQIGSFEDYRREKMAHLASTGFENGREVLELTFIEGDGEPTLSDAMLGRVERVRLERLSATLTRFELPDSSPYLQAEGGWLEFPDLRPTPAKLVFRMSPTAAPISADVAVYQTFYGENVDPEHHRVRLAGAFFEHEFKPLVPGFYSIQLSLARPMLLADLDKAVKLMTRLAEDSSLATATLVTEDNAREAEFGLGAVSSPEFELPPDARAVVEQATRIVGHFGSPPASAVLFGDLVENRRAIAMLDSLLSGIPQSFKVVLDEESASAYEGRQDIAVVAHGAAPLGQSIYVVLLSVKGEVLVPSDKELTIYSSSAHVCRHLVLDRTKIDWAGLNREMHAVAEPLEHAHEVFLLNGNIPK